MKRAHEDGGRGGGEGGGKDEDELIKKRMRLRLKERIGDLIDSDVLLRQERDAEGADRHIAAGESRELFNEFVTAQLPRLAGRACVRGADRKKYQDEVLCIIHLMLEGQLVSQAFSCCLEKECIERMRVLDKNAWEKRAERICSSSREADRAVAR